MTIWIKSRFYIAEFLLNFADPPYARVCIETGRPLHPCRARRGPALRVGLYRNCTAQRRFRKFSDPPYVWICIETISVNYEKRGDADPLYVRVCIETKN